MSGASNTRSHVMASLLRIMTLSTASPRHFAGLEAQPRAAETASTRLCSFGETGQTFSISKGSTVASLGRQARRRNRRSVLPVRFLRNDVDVQVIRVPCSITASILGPHAQERHFIAVDV